MPVLTRHPVRADPRSRPASMNVARRGFAIATAGDRWAYLLVLPSLVLVLAVVLYPLATGALMSLQDVRLNKAGLGTPFVGLSHFMDLVADPVARQAAVNTVIYVVGGVTAQFTVGLIAALTLNMSFRGVWLARLLVLLPLFLPSVVVGHMWGLLLDFRVGVINDLIQRFGISAQPIPFLADPHTALPVVMVVELWREFPWFALFLLAGLQGIPAELHEAAAVDGAGPWTRFWFITWPLLVPIIVATTILQAISLVNSPDLLIILTHGGPGNATQVASLYAFNTAYLGFDFGYAAAISVVIFLALLTFTIVYVRASGIGRSRPT